MCPPPRATVPKKIIAIARRSPSTRVTRARAKDADANETRGNESSIMGVNDHDTFSGLAPLHVAAKDGDLKKLVEIMDDGADVNIRACGEVRVGRTNEGVTLARGGVDARWNDGTRAGGERGRNDGMMNAIARIAKPRSRDGETARGSLVGRVSD